MTYCYQHVMEGNIAQNQRNGDVGEYFFDELLYECRFVIEQTNAWLDVF